MRKLEFRILNIEYSFKSVFNGWVKNVNNLRVKTGITGVHISPIDISRTHNHIQTNGKVVVMRQTIPVFTQALYTLKNTISDLLYTVYPHYPQALLLEPKKKI